MFKLFVSLFLLCLFPSSAFSQSQSYLDISYYQALSSLTLFKNYINRSDVLSKINSGQCRVGIDFRVRPTNWFPFSEMGMQNNENYLKFSYSSTYWGGFYYFFHDQEDWFSGSYWWSFLSNIDQVMTDYFHYRFSMTDNNGTSQTMMDYAQPYNSSWNYWQWRQGLIVPSFPETKESALYWVILTLSSACPPFQDSQPEPVTKTIKACPVTNATGQIIGEVNVSGSCADWSQTFPSQEAADSAPPVMVCPKINVTGYIHPRTKGTVSSSCYQVKP